MDSAPSQQTGILNKRIIHGLHAHVFDLSVILKVDDGPIQTRKCNDLYKIRVNCRMEALTQFCDKNLTTMYIQQIACDLFRKLRCVHLKPSKKPLHSYLCLPEPRG